MKVGFAGKGNANVATSTNLLREIGSRLPNAKQTHEFCNLVRHRRLEALEGYVLDDDRIRKPETHGRLA